MTNQVEHFEQPGMLIPGGQIRPRSLAEIKEMDKFRRALVGTMDKGDYTDANGSPTGADYGSIPGVKLIVFKEAIQKIESAFGLGTGNPLLEKEEMLIVAGENRITHWRITAKVPIVNLDTGGIVAVGIGTCSTAESKYRFRGTERKCPKCGKETIIKGKSEFGGGWLCFTKKGGCGIKFKDGDPEIEAQEFGKTENLNPVDVLDTCIAMAVKRATGRAVLNVTGMSKYFRLPEEIEDEGHNFHNGNTEQEPAKPKKNYKKMTEDLKKPKEAPEENGKSNPEATNTDRLKLLEKGTKIFGTAAKFIEFLDKESEGKIQSLENVETKVQCSQFWKLMDQFVEKPESKEPLQYK